MSKSIEEMATEIACSVYQSSEVMADIRKTMDAGDTHKTTMDYVAIIAVETARKIKAFARKGERHE